MPSLHRIGKEKVINHHHEVPFRVLEKQYSYWDDSAENMIIHGDNLEWLKSLLPQYEGKIKCIYIDPPYNTGNEWRVYNDNMNHPKIKKRLWQTVGKEWEDFNRHDKWLCMMYPRLKLLHKLLRDDGVIFISIDDNEQASLKLVMDEIFGWGNYIRTIACINNPKWRSDDKYIATAHENILLYKKGVNLKLWWFKPDFKITKRYNKTDHNGLYREIDLRKTWDWDTRVDRPNMFYTFIYNQKLNDLWVIEDDSIIPQDYIAIRPMKSSSEEGRWRRGLDNAKENLWKLWAKYMTTKKQWTIFEKDYLQWRDNIKPTSVWDYKDVNSERGTDTFIKYLWFNKNDFPNPKPVGTIQRILEIATKPWDIILDSFAGSWTTAHAVLNLNKQDEGNRKFILLELMDYAETITAERVKRVINGYGEWTKKTEGTGGWFSYYTVGERLFDDEENLNEAIDIETIKEYIRYTETKTSYIPQKTSYFLWTHKKTDYYFYYETNKATTLDLAFLDTLPPTTEYRLIYADVCHLSKEFLTKHKILFKKIPRDITKF